MSLPEIGALWIGPRLSILEQLCLKSFADMGHPLTLYTYGELENPPEFAEIRDAREVWDDDVVIVHEGRGSPAVHSDIFRVKMIAATGKIWVDADAYCLKPFETKDGYLVGLQKPGQANNGVLALPPDSPTLRDFGAFLATRGDYPPWWEDGERAAC